MKLSTKDRIQLVKTTRITEALLRERLHSDKCIICQEDPYENAYSQSWLREYILLGLCELCYDALFAEEAENEQDELA